MSDEKEQEKRESVLYDARKHYFELITDVMRFIAEQKVQGNIEGVARGLDSLYDLISPRLTFEEQEKVGSRVDELNDELFFAREKKYHSDLERKQAKHDQHKRFQKVRSEERGLYREMLRLMDKYKMLVPLSLDGEDEFDIGSGLSGANL